MYIFEQNDVCRKGYYDVTGGIILNRTNLVAGTDIAVYRDYTLHNWNYSLHR